MDPINSTDVAAVGAAVGEVAASNSGKSEITVRPLNQNLYVIKNEKNEVEQWASEKKFLAPSFDLFEFYFLKIFTSSLK